jgi:hypothetical protein
LKTQTLAKLSPVASEHLIANTDSSIKPPATIIRKQEQLQRQDQKQPFNTTGSLPMQDSHLRAGVQEWDQ